MGDLFEPIRDLIEDQGTVTDALCESAVDRIRCELMEEVRRIVESIETGA